MPPPSSSPLTLAERERALLDLGSAVFKNPCSLVQAHWFHYKGQIEADPHSHPDLLQIDLSIGMRGKVWFGRREHSLEGIYAIAFYPNEKHAFCLKPQTAECEYYSIKVRVPPDLLSAKRRVFKPCIKLSVANPYLIRSLRQLNRLTIVSSSRDSMICATLADVLCFWPNEDSETGRLSSGDTGVEPGQGIQSALRLIDGHLNHPPSLSKIAEAAHMSSRNFARRFRAHFGCSPRAYINARRLGYAKELLMQEPLNVTAVADQLGFPSIHSFSRWFHHLSGMSPSSYRKENLLF